MTRTFSGGAGQRRDLSHRYETRLQSSIPALPQLKHELMWR